MRAKTMVVQVPAPAPAVRMLAAADLADILALQQAVAAELPAHFIRGQSEGALRGYLDGSHGFAYGIVEQGALLAMALLRLPGAAHPNPQSDPPFPLVPATDWPCHAAFLETAMVLPAARGRGYQRTLLDIRLFRAAVSGMKWICAGANLRNEVSWTNLLAKGLAIAGLLDLGFPLIGLVAAVDAEALETDAGDVVAVASQDQARHQAALRDGYIGVRLGHGNTVIYQRLAAHAARMSA